MKKVTLKNKKTGKRRTEMRVDTTQTPKEVFKLVPGWNEFPSHVWEQNKAAPSIVKLCEEKVIELGEFKTLKGKIVGTSDEEFNLHDLDDKTAIKIVKGTLNRGMLQRWLDEENRHRVKRELEKQIKPLLPGAKTASSE